MKDEDRQLSHIVSHLDSMLDPAEQERIGATKDRPAHIRVLRVLDHYETTRHALWKLMKKAPEAETIRALRPDAGITPRRVSLETTDLDLLDAHDALKK